MAFTYSPCQNCHTVNRVPVEKSKEKTPVCSKCKGDLSLHGAVNLVDGKGLESLIAHSELPVIVDFWAEWCPPCRMFGPIFEQGADKMAGRVVFAKMDTEHNQAMAAQLGIRSIPTMILFHQGQEVMRQSGAMPLPPFLSWLEGGLKKAGV